MLNAFLIAFLSSFVFNFFLAILGPKTKVFRAQKEDGSYGVSKLGGIGIVFSFFLAVSFIASASGCLSGKFVFLLFFFAFTFLLGLLDDILDLKPLVKLFFQAFIVILLISGGIRTEIAFLPVFLNILLTFLWIMAIMNAFNLLDILDGLSAGIVCLCAAGFLFISYKTSNMIAGLLAAALLGSNLSFLRFNLFPARLYMGDMASLFNGAVLSVIAIHISYAPAGREIALLTPFVILALPLADLVFVITMRWWQRYPIIKKSRDHFALRLCDNGMPVTDAVFLMYLLNIIFIFLAILLKGR